MPNEKISSFDDINAVDIQPTDYWNITRAGVNNFKLTHSELLTLLSSQINVSQTIFVDSVFGNDGTGLRERMDKPFYSIDAAVIAAAYGDTIVIRAGYHYVFSSVIKDGVNFYAEKGAKIYSYTLMFNLDTTAGGQLINGRISFLGDGELFDMDSSGSGICVTRNNPNVVLDIECSTLFVNNISNGMVIRDGLVNLKVKNGDYYSRGRNFSMRDTGKLVAEINGYCTTDWASVFNGNFYASVTNWSGYAYIKCKRFKQLATVNNQNYVYLDNAQQCNLILEFTESITEDDALTTPWIKLDNVGSVLAVVTIKSPSIFLLNRKLFENKMPNGFIGFINVSGVCMGGNITNGEVILNSCVQLNLGATISVSGGVLKLNNSELKQQAAVAAITQSGGTVSLMGSSIITDGVTASINNTAGITLSEGSKSNVAPVNPITGNFYINPLYIN